MRVVYQFFVVEWELIDSLTGVFGTLKEGILNLSVESLGGWITVMSNEKRKNGSKLIR